MGKKSSAKLKKKNKKKPQPIMSSVSPPEAVKSSEDLVMLGIRLLPEEREKIKVYAARNQTSIAALIRQYIRSLPS